MADAVERKRRLEKGKSPKIDIGSPVFTAVTYVDNWSSEGVTVNDDGSIDFPFEGGGLCGAFNQAKLTKACPRSKIESFYQAKGYTEKEFFKKLYDIEQEFNKKRFMISAKYLMQKMEEKKDQYQMAQVDNTYVATNYFNLELSNSKSLSGTLTEYSEQLTCKADYQNHVYNDLKGIFGNILPAKEIFMKYFKLDMFDNPFNMNLLFRFICPKEKRRSINTKSSCEDYTLASSSIHSYDSLTDEIIDQLQEDSLPVGISYCSRVLKRGKNFKGISSYGVWGHNFKKKDGKTDCGNHASLVIGTRNNGGKCEFLIRNTWGTGCGNYSKDFKCENGNIWLPEDVLKNNLYRIQHL